MELAASSMAVVLACLVGSFLAVLARAIARANLDPWWKAFPVVLELAAYLACWTPERGDHLALWASVVQRLVHCYFLS